MNQEQHTAKEIVHLLDQSAAALPAATKEKLADGRQRAVAAHARTAEAVTAAGTTGYLRLMGSYFQHHRALTLSCLVLGAALAGFLITEQINGKRLEQGDAFLLGSELPPEAFLDKGFDSWLEQTSQR